MNKAIVTKPVEIVEPVPEQEEVIARKMATIICPTCNGLGKLTVMPKQPSADWLAIAHETLCKMCGTKGRITGVLVGEE